MASSRLERLGTIFTRVKSLMKCGAMNPNDKPLWYEVYEVFPPIDEPSFSRRVAVKEIKPIFYPEDRIRAKFHQGNYGPLMFETLKGEITTNNSTAKVISLTANIMKQEPNLKTDDAFEKAIKRFTAENISMLEKQKSMFTPRQRKTDNVTSFISMVNLSPQVDASTLKNIAQKDVDVTSILIDQEEEEENHNFGRDSILKDFKNASKKLAEKSSDTDDSSKKR